MRMPNDLNMQLAHILAHLRVDMNFIGPDENRTETRGRIIGSFLTSIHMLNSGIPSSERGPDEVSELTAACIAGVSQMFKIAMDYPDLLQEMIEDETRWNMERPKATKEVEALSAQLEADSNTLTTLLVDVLKGVSTDEKL
jgi:hypothetical protein